MTAAKAKAEVFLTAFRALQKGEQNAVLFGLVSSPSLREDIIDLAIAQTRNRQTSRPIRKFLSELRRGKPAR